MSSALSHSALEVLVLCEAPGSRDQQNPVFHVTPTPGTASEAAGPNYALLSICVFICVLSFPLCLFLSISFSLSLSHMHINTHTCAMWMHKWCGSTGNIILSAPWPYPACLLIDWLYPQGPQLLQITSDFLQSPRQRRLAARFCIPFAFSKYPYHIASHKFTVLSWDEIAPFLPGITHGNMVLFCFWTYCIW